MPQPLQPNPFVPNRRVLLFGIALFIVSTGFPIIASLVSAQTMPAWVGVLDVTLELAVALIMFWIDARGRGQVNDQARQRAYEVYRALGHLFLLLLVIFFLAGDRINWQVLLPGLAWRFWVLFYVLPSGFAIWIREPTD